MSGRRDRPPSGRHNISKEKNDSSFPTSTSNIPLSSRPQSARNSTRGGGSPRHEYQPNEARRMNRPASAYSSSKGQEQGKGISTSSPRRSFPDQNTNNNNNNNSSGSNNKNSNSNNHQKNIVINTNRDKNLSLDDTEESVRI